MDRPRTTTSSSSVPAWAAARSRSARRQRATRARSSSAARRCRARRRTGIPKPCSCDHRYRTHRDLVRRDGRRFRPGQFYFVGGHTKFYGTAMFRFRERDFEALEHDEAYRRPGRSAMPTSSRGTARPSACSACAAKAASIRPSRHAAAPYAHPPIPHEPVIAQIEQRLRAQGLQPFPMPAAIDFDPGGTLPALWHLRCVSVQDRRQGRCRDPADPPGAGAAATSNCATGGQVDAPDHRRQRPAHRRRRSRRARRASAASRRGLFVLSAGAINSRRAAAALGQPAPSARPGQFAATWSGATT